VIIGFGLLTYCTDDPKMAAVRHLGFLTNQIFNGRQGKEGRAAYCVTVPCFVTIGRAVAEIWRFIHLCKMAASVVVDSSDAYFVVFMTIFIHRNNR